ncbi:MAG TPA: hypothetical protein VJ302_20460 [Blastocatellia bacterium]|nr:hypothetical protein [Blastocatellia bacterium]
MSHLNLADDRGAAAHEPNAVGISGIVKFIAWLAVAVLAIALLMWGLLRYFDARGARAEPRPSPLAGGDRLPPEPRLQGAPGHSGSGPQDLRQFREQEDRLLRSYGWLDQQRGVVRIPVERAKQLILRRGLAPSTPATAQIQDGAAQHAEQER